MLPVFSLLPLHDKPWSKIFAEEYTGRHQLMLIQNHSENTDMYNQEAKSREDVNLELLANYLNSVGKVCHIVIDNYVGVNLIPLDIPIVLRRVIPGLFVDNYNGETTQSGGTVMWFPTNFLSLSNNNASFLNIVVNNWKIRIKCPLSDLVLNIQRTSFFFDVSYLCVQVDFFKYSARIKPWASQMQVGIFLPYSYKASKVSPPSVFHYDVYLDNGRIILEQFRTVLPCVSKVIYIMVEKQCHFVPEKTSLTSLMHGYENNDDNSPLLRHDEYFLAILTNNSKQNNKFMSINEYTLSQVQRVKMLPIYCEKSPNTEIALLNQQRIETSFRDFKHEKISWRITGDMYSDEQTSGTFLYHFGLCKNRNWPHPETSSFRHLGFDDLQDRFMHGIVSVWMNILHNFTIKQEMFACNNAKKDISEVNYNYMDYDALLRVRSNVKKNFHIYSFFLKDFINDLGFISCGGLNGFDSVSLKELTSIYESFVWALIVLVAIMVALITSSFSRPKWSFSDNMLMILKCLLEQGTPFQNFSSFVKQHQLVVGPFLLMSVVLSNAYKNTNVYNVISPRYPNPYKNISELVRDKFSIYTGSHTINIMLWGIERSWDQIKMGIPHNYTIARKQKHWLEEKELIFFDIYSEIYQIYSTSNHLTEGENARLSVAMKESGFHPEYASTVESILQRSKPDFQKFDKHLAMKHIEGIKEQILDAEEKLLYDFLKLCNKTALLAPMTTCNKFGRKLQLENVKQLIFVGSASIDSKSTTIQIEGNVHPLVIERLKWIIVSGLFDWWVDFSNTTDKLTKFNGNLHFMKSPNMEGNVQLIFIILVIGIIAALFVHVAEICITNYQQLYVKMSNLNMSNWRCGGHY